MRQQTIKHVKLNLKLKEYRRRIRRGSNDSVFTTIIVLSTSDVGIKSATTFPNGHAVIKTD